MNTPESPEKDVGNEALRASVEAKFRQLSAENPQNLHPIEPFSVDELGWMRKRLESAGFNFKHLSHEGRRALSQNMFRATVLREEGRIVGAMVFDYVDVLKGDEGEWVNLGDFNPERFRSFINETDPADGDRSLGVFELLGRDRFETFVVRTQEIAEKFGYTQKVAGKRKDTENRGSMQLLIDIMKAVSSPTEEEGVDLARKINHRILRGGHVQWRDAEDKVNIINHNFEEVGKPHEKLIGIPVGSLTELWRFLTTGLAVE